MRSLALVIALAIGATALPASAQGFMDRLLAKVDPCSGVELSENVFGLPVQIGLKKKRNLTVARASLSIEGDTASLDFAGGLACETTPGSVLGGDAELDLHILAQVDLASCTVGSLALTPTRYGGYLADLLEAGWEPVLNPVLRNETERLLVEACQDLSAPGG